jgi:hypothetical protein
MVLAINPGSLAATRPLRRHCERYQRIIECYPEHRLWVELSAIVGAYAGFAEAPVWIRVSRHGLSWLYPDGLYETLGWDEVDPE